MKNILIIVTLITTLYSQNNMAAIGGINYSTFTDDDGLGDSVTEVVGYRIGLENHSNGFIMGVTYSQRGANSEYEYSNSYYDSYYNQYIYETSKYKEQITLNYITGYILTRMPLQPTFSFLLGAEIGYFIDGQVESETEYEHEYYGIDYDSGSWGFDRDQWLDEMWGNDIDYGMVFGAQFKLSSKIAVVGTYYMGLTDIFKKWAPYQHSSYQMYLSYGL